MGGSERTGALAASAGWREREDDSVASCLHCGLEVPRHRLARGNRFCCSGCDQVYRLIQDAHLERYYELRPDRGVPVAGLREDAFGWLEPLLEQTRAGDLHRLALDVQGVHCAACVWLLQQLFERHEGGVQLRINPGRGTADLVWDPERGEIQRYLAEATRFGYRFGPRRARAAARSNGVLVRLGVCVAAAMNVMIFSFAYYFGLSASDGWVYRFVGAASLFLASVALVVGGEVFFRSTWNGLRRGLVHLDLPIALGLLLAYAGSVIAYALWGPEKAYFDTVTTFVTLMLFGRWMQERVLERNRNAVLSADGLDSIYVRRYQAGRVETIAASAVQEGDELLVVPGEMVPVAGRLLSPQAELSLDWITGEPDPESVAEGGALAAGAFNAGKSAFRLRAEEPFARSRVHDLLSTPDLRERQASGEERWWSRVSTIYVVSVLALAAAGFLFWFQRDATRAIQVTIAILVVTCPCAIGLAVPLSHELGLLALKRRCVFVRGAGLFERALGVRKIFFDKTGTLTLGRLLLDDDSRATLAALRSTERAALREMAIRSNHPRSRALVAALEDNPGSASAGGDPPWFQSDAAESIVEHPGAGLEWTVDGRTYRLGRPRFVLPERAGGWERPTPDEAEERATLFGQGDETIARFTFQEELRGDAAEEISRLEARGLEIELLSGDSPERTRRVAAQLGLPEDRAHGGLEPEEKSARVRERDRADTLMVGDGLNDAAGLDAAFVSGTPAIDHPSLPARADFYFLGEGIGAVRLVLAAADRVRSVVRANLTLAVAYNGLALALCFSGQVSPVSAAILMPASSISLVLLTVYRMRGREASWTS